MSGGPEAPLLRLPGEPRVARLDNGLTLCLLVNRQAPLAATALWYRAGARDEPAGQAGVAHFLEHLMFKGSERYPAGEIDRRTQALGGSNNAFTTHDGSAYYFTFSGDRWIEALEIERDRMTSLLFDPGEIETERRVILEELAMYRDDPWDALEMKVYAALFGDHPYGRPVLGRRRDLLRIGEKELAGFHRRFYRPGNAVLVLAGDLDGSALDAARERFADLPAGNGGRPDPLPARPLAAPLRVEQRSGEVARLLLALPAPAATHPDFAPLRLLLTVLAGGRASRLHAALVELEQLCLSTSSEITETLDPGLALIAAELVPGVEPARVEERVLTEIERLRREPPAAEETERARRLLISDWVFGVERIHQQAMTAGQALALFDLGYLETHLRRLMECGAERLAETARRFLRPREASVAGWSLPDPGRGADGV